MNRHYSGPDIHWMGYFLQNCVVLAMYFLINSETSSWVDWHFPYQTLFFQAHLLAMVLDSLKKYQFHPRTKQYRMCAEQVACEFGLCFALVVADSTLLVRQAIAVKNSSTTSTNAGIIQIALVGFVLFFSLLRFLASCRRRPQKSVENKSKSDTKRSPTSSTPFL